MADYLVTTDFRAKDMVSPQLKHMEAQTKRFANTAKVSLGSIFKGTFLGTMGANLVTSGLARVRSGVVGIIDDYRDLDQMLNEAAVKFGGIDYGSEKFKELSAVAREVGRTTKFQSQDAAGGLEALAAGGFHADEAMRLLPSAANFAAAAKMNLAEGTEVAVAALRAFSLASEDAEVQAKNLNRVSDILAATDAATAASMAGLSETVAWAASRFTAAGQEVETFGAIAGGLANVKIQGSMAGTVMKNMVAKLTDIGGKGTKALQSMGMSFKKDLVDNQGNLLNIIDILAKMEAPLKRMGTAKRSKVLQDLFGERAAGGVVALINNGVAAVKQLEGELMSAGGTSKRMGDQLNLSLNARIMALQNALQEKGFQLFEQFLTDGRGGIEEMIKAINKWDVTGLAEGLRDIGSGVKWLIDHREDILRLGIAFGTIKAALALKGMGTWLGQAPGMLAGMGGGMRGITLAQMLGGGMVAPPVGMPGLPGDVPGLPVPTPKAPAPVIPKYTGRYDNWGKPATVKTPKVTMAGVANVALTGVTAFVMGYEFGDWLRSKFIDPEVERAFKIREELDTSLLNLAHQIKTGKVGYEEGKKKIVESKEALSESVNFWDLFWGYATMPFTGRGPMDDLKRQAEEIRKAEESLRPPETGVTRASPIDTWEIDAMTLDYKKNLEKNLSELEKAHEKENKLLRDSWGKSSHVAEDHTEKIQTINQLYNMYSNRLEKLNEATLEATRQGGIATVNINVSGEGASKVTTETKTKGPRAPKVDVNQAGANQ